MFVINKSIIKKFLTSDCSFWLRYESSIHNMAFSSEKVVCTDQAEFTSENGSKYVGEFWCEMTTEGGLFH